MRTLNRKATRNPGTGKTADLQVQHQAVYPRSFITLPIVPR